MRKYLPRRFSLAALLLLMTVLGPICWRVAYWLATPQPTVTVSLDDAGGFFIEDEKIDSSQLHEWLSRELTRRKERGIETHLIVKANPNALHSDVIVVMDVVSDLGGVARISLHATKETATKAASSAAR